MSVKVIVCKRCEAEGINPPHLLPGAIISTDTAREAREHLAAVHGEVHPERLPIQVSNSDEAPDHWTFQVLGEKR